MAPGRAGAPAPSRDRPAPQRPRGDLRLCPGGAGPLPRAHAVRGPAADGAAEPGARAAAGRPDLEQAPPPAALPGGPPDLPLLPRLRRAAQAADPDHGPLLLRHAGGRDRRTGRPGAMAAAARAPDPAPRPAGSPGDLARRSLRAEGRVHGGVPPRSQRGLSPGVPLGQGTPSPARSRARGHQVGPGPRGAGAARPMSPRFDATQPSLVLRLLLEDGRADPRDLDWDSLPALAERHRVPVRLAGCHSAGSYWWPPTFRR